MIGVPAVGKLVNVVQVLPPSVLLNRPLPEPAYIIAGVTGSNAIVPTNALTGSVSWVQVVPPLTDLNRPELVPAKTTAEFSGLAAIDTVKELVMPVVGNLVQVAPPSVLRCGPVDDAA